MSTFFSCSSFSCLSSNSSNSSSCTSFTFPAPPNPPPAPPTTHHHQPDFSHLSFICASNIHLGLLSSENSYCCFLYWSLSLSTSFFMWRWKYVSNVIKLTKKLPQRFPKLLVMTAFYLVSACSAWWKKNRSNLNIFDKQSLHWCWLTSFWTNWVHIEL